MALFKIVILLLNLAPYLSLRIVGCIGTITFIFAAVYREAEIRE